MIEVCACTLVHPGGKVERYPDVVNEACPMHGVMRDVERSADHEDPPAEGEPADR